MDTFPTPESADQEQGIRSMKQRDFIRQRHIPDRLMGFKVQKLDANDIFLIPGVLIIEVLKLPKVFWAEPRTDAMGMRE